MRHSSLLIGIVAAFTFAQSAECQIIVTHEFSGVFTIATGTFAERLGAVPGTPFTGTLAYDLLARFTHNFLEGGRHESIPPYDAAIGLDIVVNGTLFESSDAHRFEIFVLNDSRHSAPIRGGIAPVISATSTRTVTYGSRVGAPTASCRGA